ncbi:hypothetical protein INR49_022973 [Caranx melampygus]|nr:hypothetical protein INR49_022973 [Caranx melampygus]
MRAASGAAARQPREIEEQKASREPAETNRHSGQLTRVHVCSGWQWQKAASLRAFSKGISSSVSEDSSGGTRDDGSLAPPKKRQPPSTSPSGESVIIPVTEMSYAVNAREGAARTVSSPPPLSTTHCLWLIQLCRPGVAQLSLFCGLGTVSCRSRLGQRRDEERLRCHAKEKQVAVPLQLHSSSFVVSPLEMTGVW